ALDRLADSFACGVPLGLQRIALAEERPAAGVELQGAVDDRRVLALVDRSPPNGLGVVAETLEADAHAGTCGAAPAPRNRSLTNWSDSFASNHPARGPLGFPRKAK